MKIAITTKSYYPLQGGSIMFAKMLADGFLRVGHEVILLTRTPSKNETSDSFIVHRNPSLSLSIETAKWCDAFIQVDASWRDAIPFLILGKPWFPTIHRGFSGYQGLSLKQKSLLFLERLAYRIGNSIAVSDYTLESWGIKGETIKNPYDDRIFQLPPIDQPRNIDLLFVGRINQDKGVYLLFETIKHRSDLHHLKYAYAGDGPDLEKLKHLFQSELPHVDVKFFGKLDATGVATCMQHSKILAFPTTPEWLEASPLTPLEAAACGCLIVASDVGGTTENIPPGHIIIKAGCRKSLSDGISLAMDTNIEALRYDTQDFLSQRMLETAILQYSKRALLRI
jgi:glycogen(starch) synthase